MPEATSRHELIRVLDDEARARPPAGVGDDELVAMYRSMLAIRVFDTRMLAMQRQARIGFYGPVTGQEATVVGCSFAAGGDDWIVPALREGAIAMHRGLTMRDVVAQLAGSALDPTKGRQMPCHYSHRAGKFVSMSSVIGTQISHAAGIAMAAMYRGTSEAVLGFLGDGATSSNDFHAGLNFAGVRKAPVVFVCQNNQWSISVPFARQTASASIAAKARAYGMPGLRVDGNDVLAVFEVVRGALERARQGGGPSLVEALTYRRLGHTSSDDPSRYRDEAEAAAWEAKDPIDRFRRFLGGRDLWDDAREDAARDEIAGQIATAVREVEAAPGVAPESLVGDVLARVDARLAEHFALETGTGKSRSR